MQSPSGSGTGGPERESKSEVRTRDERQGSSPVNTQRGRKNAEGSKGLIDTQRCLRRGTHQGLMLHFPGRVAQGNAAFLE